MKGSHIVLVMEEQGETRDGKDAKRKPSGNGQNYNEPSLMEIFTRSSVWITHTTFLFNVKNVVTMF